METSLSAQVVKIKFIYIGKVAQGFSNTDSSGGIICPKPPSDQAP